MSTCESKINDYQAIAIYMETKISASTNRNTTTKTPNFTQKTLKCREKNHKVAPKNIFYENRDYNSQVFAKLEFTIIRYTTNYSQGVNTISPQNQQQRSSSKHSNTLWLQHSNLQDYSTNLSSCLCSLSKEIKMSSLSFSLEHTHHIFSISRLHLTKALCVFLSNTHWNFSSPKWPKMTLFASASPKAEWLLSFLFFSSFFLQCVQHVWLTLH